MEPNKDRIRLWVEALESGKHEQTCNVLTRVWEEDDGNVVRLSHCCLGLAGQVAAENGCRVEIVRNEHGTQLTYDGEDSFLCASVREWYGLSESNPWLNFTEEDGDGEPFEDSARAATLNDDHGLGFEAIAAAIRRTYLED
jgi:hypothetical protein